MQWLVGVCVRERRDLDLSTHTWNSGFCKLGHAEEVSLDYIAMTCLKIH